VSADVEFLMAIQCVTVCAKPDGAIVTFAHDALREGRHLQ